MIVGVGMSRLIVVLALVLSVLVGCGGKEAKVPVELPEGGITNGEAQADETATPVVTPTPYGSGQSLAQLFAQPTVQAGILPSLRVIAVSGTPVAGDAALIGCADFDNWFDVQTFYLGVGGPDQDPYLLDTDSDGIACNAEGDQAFSERRFDVEATAVSVSVGAGTQTPEAVDLPSVVSADATPAATPSAVPALLGEAPLREYTAEEIGAVDWSRFERDGHLFRRVFPGTRITFRIGAGVGDYTEVDCGPEIGSSLDSRSSRTWSDYSHAIWVWFENPDDERENQRSGCIQVSKYEDWPNKEAARPALGAREVDALRAERLGEDLVYFYQVNDRSYTMPPGTQGLYEVMKTDSYIVSPDGDFTGVCWADQLPNALWSVERGFVAMPDEDVISRYRREDYTEEIFEVMRKAREAGWFYVYGDNPIGGSGYGCWQVGNPEEVPVEPCVVCDIRR